MNVIPDTNIISPTIFDNLVPTLQRALGTKTYERINRQLENYAYYEGYQHKDKYGNMVRAKDLPRPDGLHYDPTRFSTNYFKYFIDEKAKWQMSGKHGLHVLAKDDDEQSIQFAKEYEKLLYQLWKENNMEELKTSIARDRLIAGEVWCKLSFNNRTGQLKWIWHNATEVVPVYSQDDFNDLIECHVIQRDVNEDGNDIYFKQSFTLEDDGFCYLSEAWFDAGLNKIKEVTPKSSLGIDFIPVTKFSVASLLGQTYNSQLEDMRDLCDVLNQLNEDAIDSMKFEMFSMLAIINGQEDMLNDIRIQPGAAMLVKGDAGDRMVDAKYVSSSFKWSEAFKEQYARVKGAMHEIACLPQVVPQELNFGGLNGQTLQVLYQSIIQDTQEHWLSWQSSFKELFNKSIHYLYTRRDKSKFNYNKSIVQHSVNLEAEMHFVLPLPENRAELVELLKTETEAGFESIEGALQRLGVEDVEIKLSQIKSDKQNNVEQQDVKKLDIVKQDVKKGEDN